MNTRLPNPPAFAAAGRPGMGIYASAWPASCFRCQTTILPGDLRPWLAAGRPLCGDCTVRLGLGDVEGLVDALGRVVAVRELCREPRDRAAVARLQHAAGEWARVRLDYAAGQMLDDTVDEGGQGGKGS